MDEQQYVWVIDETLPPARSSGAQVNRLNDYGEFDTWQMPTKKSRDSVSSRVSEILN
ncbi:MAG: hypothetical protein ACR2IF_07050 [Terriglobales bacterium]